MQVFQSSSVLSVVVWQPVEHTERRWLVMFSSCAVIGSVFCHSWGHYVTAKSTGKARQFNPLGCCHRVVLEVPIQEGSRSLATYVKLCYIYRSFDWTDHVNIILSTFLLAIYWQIMFNPCHMKKNNEEKL
jgi:hypothetical protein